MSDTPTALESSEPPVNPALAWSLSFARGYLELGMIDKAERELATIAPADQEHPEVMSLRSHLLLARRLWPKVVEHARRAVVLFPEEPEYYVHAATALDMLGLREEGRRIWQEAPENVRTSGFFHLHVARFEARLGNVVCARDHLARAIHLDPTLRSVARRDPNLAPVLSDLAKN
jgi:lipopolysaccharide biosynthesis regulator YciM